MTAPPATRSVRAYLRRHRRAGRAAAGPPVVEPWTVLLSAAVGGGVAWQMLSRIALSVPETSTRTPVTVSAVLVVTAGLAVRAAAAVGPLVVGGAERHWLLGGPLDRRTLLMPRFAGVLGAGAALGALVAVLAGLALRSPALGWWPGIGAVVGLGVAAGTVAGQAAAVRRPPAAAGRTARAGSAIVVLGVSLAALGLFTAVTPALSAVPVIIASGVVATVATVVAFRLLGRLDRAALGAGGGLAVTARTAGAFLDPGLLLGLLEEHRWRDRRHGPSRALRGSGVAALVAADLRRAARTPGLAPLGGAMVLLPYAAPFLIPRELVAAVSTVAVWAVASRAAGGLRAVTRSSALRRAIPMPDARILAAHLVAPAVVALMWTVLALPALGGTSAIGLVLLPAGATAAVWRLATRRPPDFAAPLYDTGILGVLPLDTLRVMLQGVLLLAVLVAVQVWLAAWG